MSEAISFLGKMIKESAKPFGDVSFLQENQLWIKDPGAKSPSFSGPS